MQKSDAVRVCLHSQTVIRHRQVDWRVEWSWPKNGVVSASSLTVP